MFWPIFTALPNSLLKSIVWYLSSYNSPKIYNSEIHAPQKPNYCYSNSRNRHPGFGNDHIDYHALKS